jgi:hypothetical protein
VQEIVRRYEYASWTGQTVIRLFLLNTLIFFHVEPHGMGFACGEGKNKREPPKKPNHP